MCKVGKHCALGMTGSSLAQLFLYSVLLSAGQALFKLSASTRETANLSGLQLAVNLFSKPVFIAGCGLYALSTILWVALLRRYPLSQAYPFVIASSIILTTILGIVAFHEPIRHETLAALIIIAIGVQILSRSLA